MTSEEWEQYKAHEAWCFPKSTAQRRSINP
jgi:hypothetical protein